MSFHTPVMDALEAWRAAEREYQAALTAHDRFRLRVLVEERELAYRTLADAAYRTVGSALRPDWVERPSGQ